MPLRAVHIKISNIAGVEYLEFKPGAVTVISGPNQAGKTSVMRAIKAIAEGGHDATLQRSGSRSGEVVIEFAGGDGEKLIASRKYSRSGSSLKVVSNGNPVPSPQSFVKKLWDAMSANPIEFLSADQKTRVRILLEAMPVETPVQELREILGQDWQPDSDASAFEQIEKLHARIYLRRTEKGRELKNGKATVENLKRDLPSDEPGDYAEQVRVAVSGKQQIEHDQRSGLDQAREEYEAAVWKTREEYEAAVLRMREEHEAAIRKIDEAFQPLKEEKSAEIAQLEELSRQAQHVAGMKRTVANLHTGVQQDQAVVDKLSRQLERLQSLREGLIKELPIKGVDVIAGEIHMGGVEWKSLSESERMKIAIQVARHRVGDIPFICVDGAERFDSKNFKAFAGMIEKAGLQAITARVTDSEGLKIETGGHQSEAVLGAKVGVEQ